MRLALVTGATGMVGSHIVERLVADGWTVRALVRDRDRAAWIARMGATLHAGDILDPRSFSTAAQGCDVVFHTAAAITPSGGREEYRRVNIEGTRNAIAAVMGSGARLVHVSSVAVYGSAGRYQPAGAKTDESARGQMVTGDNDYARSKRDAEDLVMEAHRAGQIWATAVRPDVIYGPRDRQFVPRVGQLLLYGFAPIIGQGDTTLAVVHAANVADGAVRAAATDVAGGRAYNLANDFDVTCADFFRLAAEGLDTRVRLVRVPLRVARGGMRFIRLIDSAFMGGRLSVATASTIDFLSRDNPFTSERARKELGWQPPVIPADGIPQAFRTWREGRDTKR